MAAVRHLTRAPIAEALIQINVDLSAQTSLAPLEALREPLSAAGFPKMVQMFSGEFKVDVDQRGPSLVDQGGPRLHGYRFSSADGRNFVQLTAGFLSFNRLAPYESWGRLLDGAREVWPLYVRALCPNTITRIGLRYINDLSLPTPVRDFGRFLTSPPDVPPGLPQSVIAFLDRIVLQDNVRRATAIVTRNSEVQGRGERLPFILDVDVFRETAISCSSEEIWGVLEILHELKNDIFFSSITESLAESYT